MTAPNIFVPAPKIFLLIFGIGPHIEICDLAPTFLGGVCLLRSVGMGPHFWEGPPTFGVWTPNFVLWPVATHQAERLLTPTILHLLGAG